MHLYRRICIQSNTIWRCYSKSLLKILDQICRYVFAFLWDQPYEWLPTTMGQMRIGSTYAVVSHARHLFILSRSIWTVKQISEANLTNVIRIKKISLVLYFETFLFLSTLVFGRAQLLLGHVQTINNIIARGITDKSCIISLFLESAIKSFEIFHYTIYIRWNILLMHFDNFYETRIELFVKCLKLLLFSVIPINY